MAHAIKNKNNIACIRVVAVKMRERDGLEKFLKLNLLALVTDSV